jgi:hypothetical protein
MAASSSTHNSGVSAPPISVVQLPAHGLAVLSMQ